ncbi:MAG: hypothetical protein WD066_18500 [Planctomycetaceae bacterium]
MSATNPPVRTTFRIPGAWAHPGELLERLPDGFRLTPEALFPPDGAEVEFIPMPPDDQFAEIFESSCRRPATADERAIVGRYTVNIGLSGPGGSMEAARAMMRAAAAVVRAGGAGVFIDNSGLAHGGGHWIEMTDDGSPDAVSFAFVSIVAGEREIRTMGMHVMGFPDILMPRFELDDESIIDVVRYICHEDQPIGDGHLLGDEHGPRFRAAATSSDRFGVGSPMHNPFGCLKLTSLKDVAEGN